MASPSNPHSPESLTNSHNNLTHLPIHSTSHNKYKMLKDITALRTSNPHTHSELLEAKMAETCHTLVSNLIRANPTWAIDSLIKYAMAQYKDYGVTYKIISECMYDYVMDKN